MRFRAGPLVALVLAAVAAGCKKEPPPPPPPAAPPPPPEQNIVQMRFTPLYYRSILEEDARRYGVTAPSEAEWGRPLRTAVELEAPQKLVVPGAFETAHLKLETRVVKDWAGSRGGGGYNFQHVTLAITNKSEAPVAYRVLTDVALPERCRDKAPKAHNAVALKPGETAERSECIWHPRFALTINRVEVIELTPLGYQYVSRLVPSQIGLDARTSAGHVTPEGKPCQYIPWRDIEAGGATWRDVIDFYARHSCQEYSFYPKYRFRKEPGPLPAHE